mgnify:FL=1
MLKNKHNLYQNYSYCLATYFNEKNESLCIITNSNNEAKYLVNELKLILENNSIIHFRESDILPYDHFSVPEKITKERFKIVNNSKSYKKHILVASVKNLFERYPENEFFKSIKNFKIDTKISLIELINIVESLNYQKKTNVENINEYSVRGGIIDIYTPIYSNPLRVEIFDDRIESIRFFDVESQLSVNTLSEFSISNGNSVLFDKNTIDMFIDRWRDYFPEIDERYCPIFQNIKNNYNSEGYEIYYPFFFKKTLNFLELFDDYKYLKLNNLDEEMLKYNNFIQERYRDEKIDNSRPLIKPSDLFLPYDDVNKIYNSINSLNINEIGFNFSSFNELEEAISNNVFSKSKVVLMSSIPSEVEKLKEKYSISCDLIKNINDAKNSISIMYGDIVRPIHDIKNDVYIFHKEDIDNIVYQFEDAKPEKAKNTNINNIFNKGDYVIHESYGLGLYDGLEIIDTNNNFNEYIKIIYLNNENLYVPLRDINKLSSYHKNKNLLDTQLDSLSSSKWRNKKVKAKKRAIDHAAEILDVESRRNKAHSFPLKIDSEKLTSFENEFPYNETPDQIESFKAIKKDISLIKPMNRVLCGDVGFGKTEVAMRASFISALSEKQVIVIVPSTVLCEQHFNSFIKRFINYPVNIKKLNRFVSTKEREIVIDEFNEKKIDILISTHVVFNNNINFKNTGLLVIDEEHKFGIKQKNYIKDKQANIHILYLSATPIPRTMNLVYSGLKDFSFLHTAPSNRISIKSFLKLHTSQILKEALSREKNRGGQCFIVQNDISKMASIKKEINNILPNFKVGTAHGKLSKKDINMVMNDFKNGNIDGLICTTIVEMGLDIPNANTMIITNSHNFGLSQLHQLRGRVGRSDKQGYCYFLIPTMDIPNISRNRLDAVIKHSKLGEGFLIAQEDLEIRGGGEMLGDKQSGHVNDVGISLYLSMLKEAIKGTDDIYSNNNLEINFNDSSFIDDNYLPSPIERLKIYSQISQSSSFEELEELNKNLIDRCGKMPPETLNLINNKFIGLRIKDTGIKSIKSNEKSTNIQLESNAKKDIINNMINLASSSPEIYSITKDNKFIFKSNDIKSEQRRKNVNLLLDEIL